MGERPTCAQHGKRTINDDDDDVGNVLIVVLCMAMYPTKTTECLITFMQKIFNIGSKN